jgi:hypothetical protein
MNSDDLSRFIKDTFGKYRTKVFATYEEKRADWVTQIEAKEKQLKEIKEHVSIVNGNPHYDFEQHIPENIRGTEEAKSRIEKRRFEEEHSPQIIDALERSIIRLKVEINDHDQVENRSRRREGRGATDIEKQRLADELLAENRKKEEE